MNKNIAGMNSKTEWDAAIEAIAAAEKKAPRSVFSIIAAIVLLWRPGRRPARSPRKKPDIIPNISIADNSRIGPRSHHLASLDVFGPKNYELWFPVIVLHFAPHNQPVAFFYQVEVWVGSFLRN